MCGIAGATGEAAAVRAAVEAMCDDMTARGPDDSGLVAVQSRARAVALGNRRLAIIDPTPAGHQPMCDEARGITLVFNGEIYNAPEMRAELETRGERFASDCDTEVVLRAFARFGRDCVRHLRGMFAFAAWSERDASLFLARDPLGIKPLYYMQAGGEIAFASQVKALLASGIARPALSPAGIATFLARGAVAEPHTAIDGVWSLPAGCVAEWRDGALSIDRYWRPETDPRIGMSFEEAARELRARLGDSVRRHLVANAPAGVFLSGGLDSSVIAALAARERAGVRTISVVFDGDPRSEARWSDAVAAHIGSDHTRVPLTGEDVRSGLSATFAAMDQPTFDGINTYAVSKAAAASGLRVALSGLGADELFDGYGYAGRMRRLEMARRLPRLLGGAAGAAARPFLNGNREKLTAWLRHEAGEDAHALLRALFLPAEVAALTADRPWPNAEGSLSSTTADRAAIQDLTTYTRDVLLRDTDMMSMAHSLEVRVPYLDTPLVEWALRLPPAVRAAPAKRLLAEAAHDLLPSAIAEREKQGFGLPLDAWMRDHLRDEVEAELASPPEAIGALLDTEAMRATWRAFLCEGRRWHRAWALFALCRWARSISTPAAMRSAA
jgi:asparagine synthase (glutamine-hydrolysing)